MQEGSYNCDTVIVNVGGLVEFLLELSVTLARPRRGGESMVSDDEVDEKKEERKTY